MFHRASNFSLDAYVLFRDRITDHCYDGLPDRLSEQGLSLSVISSLDGAPELVDLATAAGYYGQDPSLVTQSLAGQFDRGDRCVAVRNATSLIGMKWICPDDRRRWPGFARFRLEEHGTRLLHRCYVQPQYRGRSLQLVLDRQCKEILKSEAATYSINCVGVKNFASIHNLMKVNDEYRLIYHLQLEFPIMGSRNLFPNWAREPWNSCRKNARRWEP